MKRTFKTLALLTVLSLVVTAFSAVPAMAASKGKLVKEVKIKSYSKIDGKWKDDGGYTKQSFKYDKKKNPLKITTAKYKKSGKSKPSSKHSDKFKYKYKKGKTVKRIQYDINGSTDIITKYKQGVPISQTWAVEGDIKLTYKYKSRYLTRLYYFYGEADGSEEEEGERTFNVETKKGYPVKITENFDSSSEVFKVNFYKKGAKKGLIKDATRISNSEGYLTKDVYKCTYTIKKGLITKAVVKRSRTIDTDTYDDKYVFTLKYTKTKADKKRYTSMINDVIGNLGTSTYYSEQLVYTYWY